MMPKIIHQIFWDFHDPYKLPPNSLLRNRSKVETMHPDYEYKLWNRNSCTDFVKKYDSQFYNVYTKMPDSVQLDYAILLILYIHGGFYIDMSIELCHSLEPLISAEGCNLVLIAEHTDKSKKHYISKACLVSSIQNGHVKRFLSEYRSNIASGKYELQLGDFLPNVKLLPIHGIESKSRKIIKETSEKCVEDGVLVLPPQTMLLEGLDMKLPVYGICVKNDSWKSIRDEPLSINRPTMRMT
jgi:hypothetical protein